MTPAGKPRRGRPPGPPAFQPKGEDAALLDAFLEMMVAERGAAANTVSSYRRDLLDFAAFLATRGTGLARATTGDVEAYFAQGQALALKPSTAARRLSALRQFHRFALSDGVRADDPTSRIASPRQGRRLPKYLSEAEVETLLGLAAAALGTAAGRAGEKRRMRFLALLEILYATGLRVSELVGLPLAALAHDPRFVLVRGKGGRERLVPLSETARAAIDASRELQQALSSFASGVFSPDDRDRYADLMQGIYQHDWFMVAADFDAYAKAQRQVDDIWTDTSAWYSKTIRNTARMGWFSSDRTIRQYNADIWRA